jgi:hypothetical protein
MAPAYVSLSRSAMVRAQFHAPAAPRKNRSEVFGNDEHDGILPDRRLAVKPKASGMHCRSPFPHGVDMNLPLG